MEGKVNYKIGDFAVREEVPLPVLGSGNKSLAADDITPDNIILGMLEVLKNDPVNDNLSYYRDFIYTVKPGIDEMLTSAALEAENNMDFNDAIDIYKGLLALNNDSKDHILNIAVCYDEFSQFLYSKGKDSEAFKMEDLAAKYFKILEENSDKNDRVYYYLGRFYLIRENYDKAADFLRDFIKVTDDDERKEEVKGLLADLESKGYNDEDYITANEMLNSDKDQAALDYIERYLDKFTKNWSGYYLKGIALKKLGFNKEAVDCLMTGLQYNSESADIYNELGLCYVNLGSFDKSEMYYAKALRYKPDDITIYYNLAVMEYKRGNKIKALKYCEVIKEFEPGDLKTAELISFISEDKQ